MLGDGHQDGLARGNLASLAGSFDEDGEGFFECSVPDCYGHRIKG